jgi:hypothetical protein
MTGFQRGDPFQVVWRYTVTHAAAHNGSRLGAVLGRGNTATERLATPPIARQQTRRCAPGSAPSASAGAPSMDKYGRSFHI